ncbi:MAG: hypothetical protein U0893_10635 [Chloroflexota bacterium]
MIGLARRAWARLAMVAVVTAASGGLAADRALAQAPQQPECVEKFLPAPVNEKGIQCPGEPTIWKSYTFASEGFGYYMEIDNAGQIPYVVRLAYVHRDGRVAISHMVCTEAGCDVKAANGVPFPYDPTGQT